MRRIRFGGKDSKLFLSCFIDEAGDFGEYDHHSPYYIVSVVLHEQSDSIQSQIDGLDHYLKDLGYENHAIHTGPLIRREADYEDLFIEDSSYLRFFLKTIFNSISLFLGRPNLT